MKLENFIKVIVWSAIIGNLAGCIIFSISFLESYQTKYVISHAIDNYHEAFIEVNLILYFLVCTLGTILFYISDIIEIKIKCKKP